MTGKLSTLGYAMKGSEERLDELMADVTTVIADIRYNPVSRYRPGWSRYGEQGLEKRYGDMHDNWSNRYRWEGNSLGNTAYKQPGVIRLADPEYGISVIVMLLRAERNVILLCACKDYEKCHRKVVYDLVMQSLEEQTSTISERREA